MPCQLLIAGDGPETSTLKQLCIELDVCNEVSFLGWIEQPEGFLSKIDALALPSEKETETFGLVVLEAWLQSTPVIASKADGPASVIDHNVNGLIHPIGDVKTIVEHIHTYIQKPEIKHQHGKNGHQKLTDCYSTDAAKNTIHKYLNTVVKAAFL